MKMRFLFFGFINFHKILSFDIVCIYVHKIYLYSNFEIFIDLIYTSSFFFLSHAKIFKVGVSRKYIALYFLQDTDAPVGFSEELKLIRRLEEMLKGRQGRQLLSFVKVNLNNICLNI